MRRTTNLKLIPRFVYDPSLVLYLPADRLEIGQSPNLLTNAGMESGDPPTGWSVIGAGFTIAQSAVQKKSGSYSMLCTRNGTNGMGYQNTACTNYRGITATLRAWAHATVADRGLITLNDGLGSGSSSYHSGGSSWEQLIATYKVNIAGVTLQSYLRVITGDTSVYYDDAELTVPQMMDRSAYGHLVNPEGCTRVGQGLNFDGTDDFMSLANTQMNFTSGDFSAILRVKFDTINLARTLIVRGSIDVGDGGWSFVREVNNAITVFTFQAAVTQNTLTANGAVVADTWYTLGFSRSGASVIILINGVDSTFSAASHIDPASSSKTVKIMGNNALSTFPDGQLQFAGVWGRWLSPMEHQSIHHQLVGAGL